MDPKEKFVESLNGYYNHLCRQFRDWHWQNRTVAPDELEEELLAAEALLRVYNKPPEIVNDTLAVGIGEGVPMGVGSTLSPKTALHLERPGGTSIRFKT